MKQLGLVPSIGVALALHAGAIAVAWAANAASAPRQEPAPQICQAVSLLSPNEQSWPEPRQELSTLAVPRPEVTGQAPLPRPQGDSELQPPPEAPPPLSDPHPELRPTEPVPQRRPTPPEIRWQRPAAAPAQRAPNPNATQAAPADQPAPVWAAPRILKWEAPEKVRASFHGRVVAVLTIDESGKVAAVELAQGTGNKDLDALLVRSFESASCFPATRDSTPAKGVLRQPVDFP